MQKYIIKYVIKKIYLYVKLCSRGNQPPHGASWVTLIDWEERNIKIEINYIWEAGIKYLYIWIKIKYAEFRSIGFF